MMKFYKILFLLLTIPLITSCGGATRPLPVQPIIGLPAGTDGFAWWNDTVFYEVFVRSFYDSNGDGIGDLNGLTQKLDYLNDGNPDTTTDLGITGLWLMPINASPSYHGYDVSDYYAVNPAYGTLDDFRNLLAEAHKRGMRVTIDFVMNHTSTQHLWFQAAQDPQSPFRDWYIWATSHPGYKGPWGQDVWYRTSSGYYYAIFWQGMPDLNYSNPAVVAEMEKVASFWLKEVGVDGFRLDAAKHIIEEGENQENTPSTHFWWKDFRTFYKSVNPQAMTVGEVWTSNQAVATYVQGDELDLAFNFDLAKAILDNTGSRNARALSSAIEKTVSAFEPGSWAVFLSNHDQPRPMTMLMEDNAKAKTAATVLLTIPGVPYLYYGEEIGMTGQKPDERIRTPMQWSAEHEAGFTSGTAWEVINPNFAEYNVAAQTADSASLLSHYRTLIQLRNQHAALRVGEYLPVEADNRNVLAFLRVSNEETVLVVINLGKDAVGEVRLSLETGPLTGKVKVAPLFGQGKFIPPQVNAQGGFEGYQPLPEIPANSSFILQLQASR